MIRRRGGVFLFAVVMAVASIGVFAGNASADWSSYPQYDGSSVGIIYNGGDDLTIGTRYYNGSYFSDRSRLDLYSGESGDPTAILNTRDDYGEGELYLSPDEATLEVEDAGDQLKTKLELHEDSAELQAKDDYNGIKSAVQLETDSTNIKTVDYSEMNWTGYNEWNGTRYAGEINLTEDYAGIGVAEEWIEYDGGYTGASSLRKAGLDVSLDGTSTWLGDEYTQNYVDGDVEIQRAGVHIANPTTAEFGVERSYYDDYWGETYGDRAGINITQEGPDENITLGFQQTYDDGFDLYTNYVGSGLNLYYDDDEGYGTAGLWAEDANGDAEASLYMEPDYAGLLVENQDTYEWHGLEVYDDHTVLSGGTTSTSLTLNDAGATFSTDGAPARVTGVADGHNDYDAVNYRQLKKVYAGVASVAALAAIPNPSLDKRFTLGVGFGNFEGESALAAGMKANVNNLSFTAGVGLADDEWTTSLGFGVSF